MMMSWAQDVSRRNRFNLNVILAHTYGVWCDKKIIAITITFVLMLKMIKCTCDGAFMC